MLAIFAAATIVDLLFLLANHVWIIPSQKLREWYRDFRSEAVGMDVLVIGLVVAAAERANGHLAHPSLLSWVFLSVLFQLVHDTLFYLFFRAYPAGSRVFDFFKAYAAEVGAHALWADAAMVASTALLGRYLQTWSTDGQTFALLVGAYVALYACNLR